MTKRTIRPGMRRTGGFGLTELVVALAIGVGACATIGLSLHAGMRVVAETRLSESVQNEAQTLIEYLLSLSFGLPTDPLPTVMEVVELFDGDTDLGTITLYQVSNGSPPGGWSFMLSGGPTGLFTVEVDEDVDDDGGVSGALETSGAVLRIRILHDGQLVLATTRYNEI